MKSTYKRLVPAARVLAQGLVGAGLAYVAKELPFVQEILVSASFTEAELVTYLTAALIAGVALLQREIEARVPAVARALQSPVYSRYAGELKTVAGELERGAEVHEHGQAVDLPDQDR